MTWNRCNQTLIDFVHDQCIIVITLQNIHTNIHTPFYPPWLSQENTPRTDQQSYHNSTRNHATKNFKGKNEKNPLSDDIQLYTPSNRYDFKRKMGYLTHKTTNTGSVPGTSNYCVSVDVRTYERLSAVTPLQAAKSKGGKQKIKLPSIVHLVILKKAFAATTLSRLILLQV